MTSSLPLAEVQLGRHALRRIALISPWPDQRTGIADYAYDLAHGLSVHCQVDVFTSCQNPLPPSADSDASLKNIRVRPLEEFSGGETFDQVVYQMGNCSDFHADQIPVLAKNPGVVHLHDMTLHHLMAFFLFREDVEAYYDVLRYWYGPATARMVREHNISRELSFWDSERVSDVPFFDPVLQYAQGCIVHSSYARTRINERWPGLPTTCIPQVYRNVRCKTNVLSKPIRVGVFGIVQPHKHVEVLLEAVADSSAQQVEVEVCGALEPSCEELPQLAESLGIADRVTFHGRLPEAEFLQKMSAVDICVSLRYPTMGETSAVVSRALQLGLPTFVNEVGWYAELPDCVKKLPVDRKLLRASLRVQLSELADKPQQLADWQAECASFARQSYSFEVVSRRYLSVLDQLRQAPKPPSLTLPNSAA